MSALGAVAAGIFAITLPSVYYVFAISNIQKTHSIEAASLAKSIERIIQARPDFWEFESVRLIELISQPSVQEGLHEREIQTVTGKLVAKTDYREIRPIITLSVPFFDSGRPAGSIIVRHSIRSEITTTALLGCLSSFLGCLIYFIFRIYPIRKLEGTLTDLKREKEKFEKTLYAVGDGIITADLEGNILSINRAAESFVGMVAAEAVGRQLDEVYALCPDEKKRHEGTEGVLTGKDGKEYIIEEVRTPLADIESNIYGVVIAFRNITERKQAEQYLQNSNEQLRALSTQLQSIREEERTTISREVHDELGQALTALKMDLSWLKRKLPAEQEEIHQKIRPMLQLIDNTIQSVRRICSELRPGILDDLGLMAAIEWETGEFQRRSGIECRLIAGIEDFNLDREQNTITFRILQETLTNISRHAKASRVSVELKNSDGQLIMEIEDNGKGITQADIVNPKSLGILGMRERAYLFRGELDINGISGKGTTVTLRMPIKSERMNKVEQNSYQI